MTLIETHVVAADRSEVVAHIGLMTTDVPGAALPALGTPATGRYGRIDSG